MTSPRAAVTAGIRDVSPALLGSIPFGLAFGAAAIDYGFSSIQTILMSTLMFAGAAQFAALELLSRGASPIIVVLAIVIVNGRFLMYSASFARFVRDYSAGWRLVVAFLLTDMSYAYAMAEFPSRDDTQLWYYLGVGVPVWLAFSLTTVVGVVIGARIPPGVGINFVIPLVFIGLLAPAITDRASLGAAIIGGSGAVIGADIPFNAGILVATLIGILAGMGIEWGLQE